jgi:hypothetical protein
MLTADSFIGFPDKKIKLSAISGQLAQGPSRLVRIEKIIKEEYKY